MSPMAIFRPTWFALRQQRRLDDLYVLVDALQNGQPIQTLVNKQPGKICFSQRPRGWFTNGIGRSNETLLGADGAALRIGASWSPLFARPEDFRVWQNDVNTRDEVHDVEDLVRRYAFRQPLNQHDHARQLHLELEFPIYFTKAVRQEHKTRVYFQARVTELADSCTTCAVRESYDQVVTQLEHTSPILSATLCGNNLNRVRNPNGARHPSDGSSHQSAPAVSCTSIRRHRTPLTRVASSATS